MEKKICNMCGNPLDIYDVNHKFELIRNLGYGMEDDGEVLDLNICCKCMNKLIKECEVSPILSECYPEDDEKYIK